MTGRVRVTAAKVALWVQTGDNPRGYLAIFDDFVGEMKVDFNYLDLESTSGFREYLPQPGGRVTIEGSYARYVSAGWVDPNALEAGHLGPSTSEATPIRSPQQPRARRRGGTGS